MPGVRQCEGMGSLPPEAWATPDRGGNVGACRQAIPRNNGRGVMTRTKLKITLYSTSASIRSQLRTAFEGHNYHLVEITDSVKATHTKGVNERQQDGTIGRLNLPLKVDAIVSVAALNRATEGLAATCALRQGRNDVFPIVLPEGLDYLRDLLDRKAELVLVGADQAK